MNPWDGMILFSCKELVTSCLSLILEGDISWFNKLWFACGFIWECAFACAVMVCYLFAIVSYHIGIGHWPAPHDSTSSFDLIPGEQAVQNNTVTT